MDKTSKLTFNFDPIGNTMTIWWGDKQSNAYGELSDHSDDILLFDKNNSIIGVEKLNFFPKEISKDSLQASYAETASVLRLDQKTKSALLGNK